MNKNIECPFKYSYKDREKEVLTGILYFSEYTQGYIDLRDYDALRFDLSSDTFNKLYNINYSFGHFLYMIYQHPKTWYKDIGHIVKTLDEDSIFELYNYLYRSNIINKEKYLYLCHYINKTEKSEKAYFKCNKSFLDAALEDFFIFSYKKKRDFNFIELEGIKQRLNRYFELLQIEEKNVIKKHYIDKKPFAYIEKTNNGAYFYDREYFEKFITILQKFKNKNICDSILYDIDLINGVEKYIDKRLYKIPFFDCEDLSSRTKNYIFRAYANIFNWDSSFGDVLKLILMNSTNWFNIRSFGEKSATELLNYYKNKGYISNDLFDYLYNNMKRGIKNGKLV